MLKLNQEKLDQLLNLINQNFPNAKAVANHAEVGDSSISIEPCCILKVAEFLKTNNSFPFNVLQVISGVDYVDYFEVCYMLANFDLNKPHEMILKTKLVDRVAPNLDSVSSIWPAANYQERECYDMFGIQFNNHPDPRRILCPDDWQGFPLRKDYVAQKVYNGMEVYPDDKMNMADREFIVRQKAIQKAQQEQAN